ncbi:MAG: hypothetical protein IPG79_01335 [Saprospiraceae bacterium]|nr:hypothetical protein [Saprospiraceae bacterium]
MSDEEFDEKYNYGVPQGIPRGRLEKRREEQMTKYNRPQVNNINNFKNKTKISTLKNSGLKNIKILIWTMPFWILSKYWN